MINVLKDIANTTLEETTNRVVRFMCLPCKKKYTKGLLVGTRPAPAIVVTPCEICRASSDPVIWYVATEDVWKLVRKRVLTEWHAPRPIAYDR